MTTLPNQQCYTLNNDKATFTVSNINCCSLFAIIFSPIHTGSGEDPYRVYNNLLMYMVIYIKLKKPLKWGGEESYHSVCVFPMVAAKFVNTSCFVGDE
jgi:hypothetical protein